MHPDSRRGCWGHTLILRKGSEDMPQFWGGSPGGTHLILGQGPGGRLWFWEEVPAGMSTSGMTTVWGLLSPLASAGGSRCWGRGRLGTGPWVM